MADSALTSAGEAPLLAARGLEKGYPSGGRTLRVLRGVDFEIRSGEVVAITGESGTGKSTLLHLLGALDRPDGGSVYCRGNPVFGASDEELAAFRNREIGFVFQFHHLLPEFTALENVAMPALIRQRRLSEVRECAMALLGMLGLAERADHRPGELSGGEQQRVAVARALMNEPGLILADEPSGNLDAGNAAHLHEEMIRLSREVGCAFVIATHNLALAADADRALRLKEGVLRTEGG